MNLTSVNPWLAVLLLTVAVRLCSLGAYPLADTTEARYAEIGRVMLTTGNWTTPQLGPGEPFWAKPPLSVWLTASSFALLGVSGFAARLPALLCLLAVTWLVYRFHGRETQSGSGVIAATILISSTLGFISAGAVMTDSVLLVTTSVAMLSFRNAVVRQQRAWAYVFFIALTMGMLAKGGIAWVLTGLPLMIWTLWKHRVRDVIHAFPWIEGCALIALLTLPWFLLAEIKTPGFLHYFVVGEHIQRILDSGWRGDLYGSAHARPRGLIWLYALLAFAPWSALVLFRFGHHWRQAGQYLKSMTDEQHYLLL